MKNKINFATYFVLSTILFFLWCDNANAASNNCNDQAKATFKFSVAPAISVAVTNDVDLANICPGCTKTWGCEDGTYQLVFTITGSTACYWTWNSPSYFPSGSSDPSYLMPIPGQNNHAGLEGCWYQLTALPNTWTAVLHPNPATTYQFLDTTPGMGIGKLKYNITRQWADCDASGQYQFTVKVNADYACSMKGS
jgi:hypothetical protein